MANYLNPNATLPISQATQLFGIGPLSGYMAGQDRANQQTQMAGNNLMANLDAIKTASGIPATLAQNQLATIAANQKIQQAPLAGQVATAGLQDQLQKLHSSQAKAGMEFTASVFPSIQSTIQQYGINSPQTKQAWQVMGQQYQQVTGKPLPPQFAQPNARGLLAMQTAHDYIVNNSKHQQDMEKTLLTTNAANARQQMASQAGIQEANIRAGASRYSADQTLKGAQGKFNIGEMATLGVAHQLAKANPALYSDGQGNPNQLAMQTAASQILQNNLHPSAAAKANANAAAQEAASAGKVKGTLEGIKSLTNPKTIEVNGGTKLHGAGEAGYQPGRIYGGKMYLGGNHLDPNNWADAPK